MFAEVSLAEDMLGAIDKLALKLPNHVLGINEAWFNPSWLLVFVTGSALTPVLTLVCHST